MPKFVTKTMHAYIDYPVALLLLIAPFALGLGGSNPVAFWLSIVIGAAAFVLTLLTDHQTGLIRVLPYKWHLAVDFAVGLLFVAAPLILGFTGIDLWFYCIIGLTVLAVVSMHKPDELPLSTAEAVS